MQTKALLCCRAALLLLIVSLTPLLSSCGRDEPVSKNIMLKKGLICLIDDGEPYTGKIHDVISSQVLEYDVVDGIKEGNFSVYSEAGKILISGRMKNNKNDGHWLYYYPDGQLESQGYFKDDNTSDEWFWYFPDGRLKATGYYLKGKKDGLWRNYDENGKVVSEEVYRNNVKTAGMEEKLS